MSDEAATAARLFPQAAAGEQKPAPSPDAPVASRLFPQADADAKARAEQQAQPKLADAKQKPGEQPKPAQDQPKPGQQQQRTPEALAKAAGEIASAIAEHGFDPAHADSQAFGSLAAELGLSADSAKRLAAFDQQRSEAAWEQQFQTWDKATSAEFLASELEDARSIVAKYGDAELDDLLTNWGLGSHPAIVRFVRNIARGRK